VRAAICYEAGKPLAVEDGVTVDAPGKGEVKVRVAGTAVCHSDLHYIKGDRPADQVRDAEICMVTGLGPPRPGSLANCCILRR